MLHANIVTSPGTAQATQEELSLNYENMQMNKSDFRFFFTSRGPIININVKIHRVLVILNHD